MPKQMEFTLSFYAKELDKLEGALPEQERLDLLDLAKKMTAEENEEQHQKTDADLRKDLDHICKPHGWWGWDEEKREEWRVREIGRMQAVVYSVDDHYFEDIEFSLPSEWAVCGRCCGEGVHDPESFSNGWTESEWAQEDCEFKENYLDGAYDVACTECGGKRVMPHVNEGNLNDGQKHLCKLLYRDEREEADYEHMCAMERRMGA